MEWSIALRSAFYCDERRDIYKDCSALRNITFSLASRDKQILLEIELRLPKNEENSHIYWWINELKNDRVFCFSLKPIFKLFLKVYFPTSTHVHLHLWTYQTEDVIEVNIFPSIFDEEQSRGLCNKLGSNQNELVDAHGHFSRSRQQFVDSWRYAGNILYLLQMHFSFCNFNWEREKERKKW